jgi:protocatechuate 3,4-dioxygenase beta subunit
MSAPFVTSLWKPVQASPNEAAARFSRREALAGAGVVTLGSVLAACGGGEETAKVATTDGETATVQSKTHGDGTAAELFDHSASCSLAPEQTEGPFYFDVDKIRSDVREDREGTPLRLALRVRDDATGCKPVENAVVEIWHCDGLGAYSGFGPASTGGGGPSPGGGTTTDEETFLRGAQVTNADGIVEFRTIYPGSYPGRTVHIHAMVHLDRTSLLTTQLYFDDKFTERIYAEAPYSQGAGRDTLNSDDSLFDESLLLTLTQGSDDVTGMMTFDVESA